MNLAEFAPSCLEVDDLLKLPPESLTRSNTLVAEKHHKPQNFRTLLQWKASANAGSPAWFKPTSTFCSQ